MFGRIVHFRVYAVPLESVVIKKQNENKKPNSNLQNGIPYIEFTARYIGINMHKIVQLH